MIPNRYEKFVMNTRSGEIREAKDIEILRAARAIAWKRGADTIAWLISTLIAEDALAARRAKSQEPPLLLTPTEGENEWIQP